MNDNADAGALASSRLEALLTHAAWVRGLAAHLVRDPHAREDIVQEVWRAVLSADPTAAVRHPRGWLAGTVRHLAAMRRRAETRRHDREQSVPPPSAAPSTDVLVAEQELRRRLIAQVDDLPEGEREVVLLRFWQDLPPREIAKRLGIPVNTVRSRTTRALERLRSRLDGEHGDRRTWCLALVPLLDLRALRAAGAGPAGVAGGKLALGATAAALALGTAGYVFHVGWRSWEPADFRSDAPADQVLARFAPEEPSAPSATAAPRRSVDTAAPPPGRFVGQVVDLDGRPIAGASVPREQRDWMAAMIRDGRIDATEWLTTTDADGRFAFGPSAFRVWPPKDSLRIGEILHEDYVAEVGDTEWPLAAEPRLVMRPTVDVELDIEVVEKGTGAPVPRFDVSLDAFWGKHSGATLIVAGDPHRRHFGSLREADGWNGRLRRPVRLVSGVENRLTVHISGADRITEMLPKPTGDGTTIHRRYEVEFDASAQVPGNLRARGRILDEATAEPVAGAYVRVEVEDPSGVFTQRFGAWTTSRADGSFALGVDPREEPIAFVVSHPDHVTERAAFRAEPGVELRLARYSSLTLRVTAAGRPLPGAHLLLRHDRTPDADGHARGVTDEHGVARFERLPPVRMSVFVVPGPSAPDEHAIGSASVALARGVHREATLDVQPPDRVTVDGTIVAGHDATPLVPVFVPLDADRGWVQARPRGASGYSAGGLPRGRYLVLLVPADDAHRDGPFAFLPPVAVTAPLAQAIDLVLPQGTVRGRILGIAPGTDLRIVAAPALTSRSVAVDQLLASRELAQHVGAAVAADGTFELGQIADGQHELQLRRGAVILARRGVEVRGGLLDIGPWLVEASGGR